MAEPLWKASTLGMIYPEAPSAHEQGPTEWAGFSDRCSGMKDMALHAMIGLRR